MSYVVQAVNTLMINTSYQRKCFKKANNTYITLLQNYIWAVQLPKMSTQFELVL